MGPGSSPVLSRTSGRRITTRGTARPKESLGEMSICIASLNNDDKYFGEMRISISPRSCRGVVARGPCSNWIRMFHDTRVLEAVSTFNPGVPVSAVYL